MQHAQSIATRVRDCYMCPRSGDTSAAERCPQCFLLPKHWAHHIAGQMTETRAWIWDLWLLSERAGAEQHISQACNQGENKAGTEDEAVSVVQLKHQVQYFQRIWLKTKCKFFPVVTIAAKSRGQIAIVLSTNTCTMENVQNPELLQVKQAGLNEVPFQFVFTQTNVKIWRYFRKKNKQLLCW